jgi:hypothetical protein
MFSVSALEFALERLGKDPSFKKLEIYLPSELLSHKGFSCQVFGSIALASGKPWQFYEWMPRHTETKRPIECGFAILGQN